MKVALCGPFSVPVCLGGPSSESRDDYEAKLPQACSFYRQVARLAEQHGVTVALHPHSHHTSLVLTPGEYDRLLTATAAAGIMFNPDTGHLFRGGHDRHGLLREVPRADRPRPPEGRRRGGSWQPLGKGVLDFPALLRWLEQSAIRAGSSSEEESEVVWQDPTRASPTIGPICVVGLLIVRKGRHDGDAATCSSARGPALQGTLVLPESGQGAGGPPLPRFRQL